MLNQIEPEAQVAAQPAGEVPVHELYPNEINRWMLMLGIPMLVACFCIALAIGTHFRWLYGGAIAFGPGLGVLAIMYLAISSDTNGERSAPEVAGVRTLETAPAAAAA